MRVYNIIYRSPELLVKRRIDNQHTIIICRCYSGWWYVWDGAGFTRVDKFTLSSQLDWRRYKIELNDGVMWLSFELRKFFKVTPQAVLGIDTSTVMEELKWHIDVPLDAPVRLPFKLPSRIIKRLEDIGVKYDGESFVFTSFEQIDLLKSYGYPVKVKIVFENKEEAFNTLRRIVLELFTTHPRLLHNICQKLNIDFDKVQVILFGRVKNLG